MIQTCGFGPNELHIVSQEFPKSCWVNAGVLALYPAYSDSSKQTTDRA